MLSDLERQRQHDKEVQRRVNERIQSRIHYQKQPERALEPPPDIKVDQVAQTDHQVDRVVYIDEPRVPSVATKAFVRNLKSSSVQQHMSWDAESICSHRTDSDMFVFLFYFLIIYHFVSFNSDFKSNTARDLHRKHYTNGESNVIRKPSSTNQEDRATNTHSPLIKERQPIRKIINKEKFKIYFGGIFYFI